MQLKLSVAITGVAVLTACGSSSTSSGAQSAQSASASPSASPSPSATPSATPGRSIFSDAFSSQDNWPVVNNDKLYTAYYQERYRVYLRTSTSFTITPNGASETDTAVTVSADSLKYGGSAHDEYGVLCFKNGKNAYQFRISGSAVSIYRAGDADKVLITTPDGKKAIKSGIGDTNKIRGVCDGSQPGGVSLKLYVNDTLMAQIIDQDSPLTPGAYGLVAYSDAGSTDLQFDNFRINAGAS